MTKLDIIELLEPLCNGCDIPLSLNLNYLAEIIVSSDQFKNKEKLESAAPIMLEALQNVRPYLAAVGTNGNHWLPIVDYAIKKATE